ncbi:MAG: IPT/TIG domain-containing protein, partial [Phycisphaerales bacterium]
MLSLALRATAQTCPGDFTTDAQIDGTDLGLFLAAWGPCPSSPCAADFNGDSQVDGLDLGQLLASWGPCRPVITSVAPAEGSAAGGTAITITGRFFRGTTSLRIGGVPASSVTVASSSSITAVTPAGVAGPATVAVTANGTGVLAGGFTYRSSSILGVSPSIGPTNGGTAVTISGEYLSSPTSVWFGQSPAQSFSSGSASSITAVAPPGATGLVVDVRVVTPAGTAVSRVQRAAG